MEIVMNGMGQIIMVGHLKTNRYEKERNEYKYDYTASHYYYCSSSSNFNGCIMKLLKWIPLAGIFFDPRFKVPPGEAILQWPMLAYHVVSSILMFILISKLL